MGGEMAEAPTLGTFFKAKAKKKTKPTEEDGAWEEEQVVATTLKVEVAGKLIKDEEKKDDEDTAAPAWGNIAKEKKEASAASVNEKKFPTLQKAVGSSSI